MAHWVRIRINPGDTITITLGPEPAKPVTAKPAPETPAPAPGRRKPEATQENTPDPEPLAAPPQQTPTRRRAARQRDVPDRRANLDALAERARQNQPLFDGDETNQP